MRPTLKMFGRVFLCKFGAQRQKGAASRCRTHCEAMYKCALRDFCAAENLSERENFQAFLSERGERKRAQKCARNIADMNIFVIEREGINMTENEQKRLQMLRGKLAQIKAQEKAILAKDKKKQRKERTRRLIQNGALAEKYLGCEGMNPYEFEKRLKSITKNFNKNS